LQNELTRLKPTLKSTLKDSTYVNTLNDLAFAMRFYKRDSLLTLSNEALEKSRSIGYQSGNIVAQIGIGDYYSDQGLHDQGIVHYGKALEAAQGLKDDRLILYAENRLAGEYEYKGDYAMALQEMLKGIEIATELNDKEMLSIFNENIALLYAAQKDYDEALNYLNTSKKFNDEVANDVFSAHTYANMASVYADAHQYDYAMFNVNKSISILEKHGIMDWLAFAYETKGKTYLRQSKFKWAKHWYDQSEMLHQQVVDDERAKIDLLQGLAETNLGLDKDSISEHYAQKAYELAKKLNVKEGMKDASKTLYKIYKRKNNFVKALAYHEFFERLSDTLARNESKKSLLMLKTRVNHEKQKEDLISENEKALAEQKNYLTGILGVVLVLVVITFLVKRSERIQRNLNKELTSKKVQLEENEHELLEINETKDKLFSIIGHDLRGPIGAFQGLLQLFKKGEVEQEEFLSFIPKFKSDIDHISFTLNNLLSWGQSQMNGSTTKPSVIDLEHIVTENVNLLSEIAANKSIKVINKIEQDTLVWSDPHQIDIVIRNLISNALKFTPKKGSVTISAFEKNEHLEISVQDTGIGIDRETQDKLFAKNSNLTTYGTENEKGTGLGLNLCKEMVENNKGSIWVNSIPNKGTCFKFTLPRPKKIYEKAS
jgi:signal transduction histidine kinase